MLSIYGKCSQASKSILVDLVGDGCWNYLFSYFTSFLKLHLLDIVVQTPSSLLQTPSSLLQVLDIVVQTLIRHYYKHLYGVTERNEGCARDEIMKLSEN